MCGWGFVCKKALDRSMRPAIISERRGGRDVSMKDILSLFAAFLLVPALGATQEWSAPTSQATAIAPAPAAVSAPTLVNTAGGVPAEMIPLTTPPLPLPQEYQQIFMDDYRYVLTGNKKLIKSVAIAYYGYLEGLGADFSLTVNLMGGAPIEPLNWNERRYTYPEGASEYTQDGIKLITWWREYNYWYDLLQPRIGELARGTPEKRYEALRLAGMVLWYEKVVSEDARKLIRKIDADNGK